MNLSDLQPQNPASKALKEHYRLSFDVNKMDLNEIRKILKKVRSIANETRSNPSFHKEPVSPSYMKLVFMEQALVKQHNKLMSAPRPRIVVENEEIEKSQVFLAAQDMVDSVQKMVEDVSDMLVKELPALVDSIQSEIGSNESDAFNSQVSEALSELNSSLATTKSGLQKALNAITGQSDAGFDTGEGGDEFDLGGEEGGDEFDLGGEGEEGMPGEEGDEEFSGFNAHGKTFDRSPEEPEPKALGRVGRKKR